VIAMLGELCEAPEQPAKDYGVERQDRVPVGNAEQAAGGEARGLDQPRPTGTMCWMR